MTISTSISPARPGTLVRVPPIFCAVCWNSLLTKVCRLPSPVAVAQPSTVATQQGLQALLDSGELQKEEKSINRFMLVLSTLYRDNPEGFTQATEIKGRKRVYFSQDPEALRASGSTTKPKPVPETPFWVITNTNTSRKQNMVAQLMASMGYGEEVVAQVCGAI